MKGSFKSLIGTPYTNKDCWGIAKDFYRMEFGIELKSYYDKVPNDRDIANSIIYSSIGDFTKVELPEYGDLILIKYRGIESHVGVYIGENKMLHSTHTSDCVVENLERWKNLIVGYYRVKKDD